MTPKCNILLGAGILVIALTSGQVGAASNPHMSAGAGKCLSFSGWKEGEGSGRQYLNTTDGVTLLEYQAPGDEDENGPVPPGSASFVGSFSGLKPGQRYELRSSIRVERSGQPYVLTISGLKAGHPDYKVSVASGESSAVRVFVTATAETAHVIWSTGGHNKMWAFVLGTSLCPA